MTQQWTVQKILNYCVEFLKAHNDEHPRRSAEWILSAATSLSRVELYAYFDRPVSMQERTDIREALKRRAQGEPLQYITGESAFRHIVLHTEKGVLIPRPETEMLTQIVIDALKDKSVYNSGSKCNGTNNSYNTSNSNGKSSSKSASNSYINNNNNTSCAHNNIDCDTSNSNSSDINNNNSDDSDNTSNNSNNSNNDSNSFDNDSNKSASNSCSNASYGSARFPKKDICVLEVGTGTGCIALSLAKECGVQVIATDINPKAIACAKHNAEMLGLDAYIDFIECDCVEGLEEKRLDSEKKSCELKTTRFDVLISNPPYIPSALMNELPVEVSHFESHIALDGGEDGLDFFRRLLSEALPLLKNDGIFACELHETCLDQAARLAQKAGLQNVRIMRDLAQKPRVLYAVKL